MHLAQAADLAAADLAAGYFWAVIVPFYAVLGYPPTAVRQFAAKATVPGFCRYVLIPAVAAVLRFVSPPVFITLANVAVLATAKHALWRCKYPAHIALFYVIVTYTVSKMAAAIESKGLLFDADSWMESVRIIVVAGLDPLTLHMLRTLPSR